MQPDRIRQIVEAAIFAADSPLDHDALLRLFDAADRPGRAELTRRLEEIDQSCIDRGIELRQVASGFRFQVRKDLGPWVSRLWQDKPPRYSRAVLETLALMAYRQPITRGEIEEIRGVSVSSQIVRGLLERGWVRIVGHRDVPGRPAMFATTREFLDYFDLGSLEDLPPLSEIRDLDKLNEELALSDVPIEQSLSEDAGDGPIPVVRQEGAAERPSGEEPEVDDAALADMARVDTVNADFETEFRRQATLTTAGRSGPTTAEGEEKPDCDE